MNFLIIPVILFLGIVTSYEDIKSGKIRNKWILLCLSLGVLFYIVFFIQTPQTMRGKDFILNASISFLICILLWKFRYWPAGDAKLFFTFSLLIPFEYYKYSYLSYFPSFVLLVNIFVPMFAVILTLTIINIPKLINVNNFSKTFADFKTILSSNWREYLTLFLGFTAIMLLGQTIREVVKKELGITKESIIVYLIFFLAYRPLYLLAKKKIFMKIINFILAGWLLYGLINFPGQLLSQIYNVMKGAIVFMAGFGCIYKIISMYSEKTEVSKVQVCKIEPGSVLTDKSVLALKQKLEDCRIYADGITHEDIEMIKNSLGEDEELEIQRTIPFAPIAFCGVIITLIFKQSILHLFLSLIK